MFNNLVSINNMYYTVTFSDGVCGGILTSTTGELSSPNFPSQYQPDLSCFWVIKPKDAKIIDITFHDTFDIRRLPGCDDSLIMTYPGIQEPLVECGKDVLDKTVEADQVWVEFITNKEDEGQGFKMTYTSQQEGFVTKAPG